MVLIEGKTMNIPKVSIIIPVYNGEDYIREAIDSALNQTYRNIEIIVVNDGSVDDTEKIAMSYGDKIRYFKKENGGVSSALNLGIREMQGEYFSWLSHDDVYYPGKISAQIEAIGESDRNKKRFSYGNYTCLQEVAKTYQSVTSANKLYGELCEKSLFPVLFNLINGCTVLIHKSLFDENGLFDENFDTSQDYDMWFRLLRNEDPVYIEKSLVITRMHSKQGSKTINAFSDNCQRLQIDMIKKLAERQIDEVFGGAYKFYADMIMMSIKNDWQICVETLYSDFMKIKEPPYRRFDKNIFIYGAGYHGRRVLEECFVKGIEVKAVVDTNSDLWGQKVCGVKCRPLSEIPVGSELWIAVGDDQEIQRNLIERGYKIKSFYEVNMELFDIIPKRSEIVDMVERYKNGWMLR